MGGTCKVQYVDSIVLNMCMHWKMLNDIKSKDYENGYENGESKV